MLVESERAVGYDTESPIPGSYGSEQTISGNVEMVITSPVGKGQMLDLYGWVREVAEASITEVIWSRGEDPVVRATLGRPVPFREMLARCPQVTEVTAEPRSGNGFLSTRLRLVLSSR